MMPKKGVIILVAVAILFATIAVSLNSQSNEMFSNSNSENEKGREFGKISVDILPTEVEDKGKTEVNP